MIVQAGDMRAMSEALMDALGLSQADVMRQRGPLTNGEQEAISDQRAAFDAKDAEIQRLRSELRSRGECICVRCGLRQEAASPQDMSNDPPFMF